MNTMVTESEPKLAPPGAGLPKPELFIARLLFALQRRTGNRASHNARFQRERGLVRDLVRNCDEAAASKRVLIDRVPGLEDSSRYWSVWMTLDHLRIMHGAFARIIETLGRGEVPPGKVSTANVKPGPDVTASVVEQYEQSCDAVLAAAERVPDLNTAARLEHPWFGPLNAAGWHAIAPTHLEIHRKQIQRIVAGLGSPPPP